MKNTTAPNSSQPQYYCDSALDLVFPLSGYVLGESIRIHGQLDLGTYTPSRGQTVQNGRFISPLPGAHALFATMTTRVNDGQFEFIAQYPNFASQYFALSESTRETCNSLESTLELRSGNEASFASASSADAQGSINTIYNARSFSVKPLCALTSTPLIDCVKNVVSLSVRLAQSRDFIVSYGGNQIAASLRNVYISYDSVDAPTAEALKKEWAQLPMTVISTQQLNIRSPQEFASINIALPGIVTGYIGSFAYNDPANQNDRYALANLPGLKRIRYTLDGRDVQQTYPYQLPTGNPDPLLLVIGAQEALRTTGRLAEKPSGVFGARDRAQYALQDVVGQPFIPGIRLAGSSTLGIEIQSEITDVYTMYVSFISRVPNLM